MTVYGVFAKINGKWVRVPNTGAYRKSSAIRFFQGLLLNGSMNGTPMSLRVVRQPIS